MSRLGRVRRADSSALIENVSSRSIRWIVSDWTGRINTRADTWDQKLTWVNTGEPKRPSRALVAIGEVRFISIRARSIDDRGTNLRDDLISAAAVRPSSWSMA